MDLGAASPDCALAAHPAAVPVEGGDADQRGDLPSVEGSDLWEVCDQGAGGCVADAGDGFEQVLGLAPCGGFADGVSDLGFEVGEFALQGGQHAVDASCRAAACEAFAAVSFGGHHLDDLAPSGNQLAERAGLVVGQRPGLRVDRLGEVGDRLGVEGVGLGELAGRAGEVADLARVDHRQRQPGGAQRRGHRRLVAAGRLECCSARGLRADRRDNLLKLLDTGGQNWGIIANSHILRLHPAPEIIIL